MKISLLREFIVLSEVLNFSKTAQQLYISQSALSKHIDLLESEIGTLLFVRNPQNVELTRIGKIFLDEAIRIVHRYDAGMKRVREELDCYFKEIRIGYLHEHGKELLVKAVQIYKESIPDIKLVLMSWDYDELPKKLKNGEVDIILTLNYDREITSWCNTATLYHDVLSVVARSDHRLSSKKSIEVKDLASEHVLLPADEKYNEFSDYVNAIYDWDHEFKGRIDRYDCVTSSLLMVEAENCVAVMPKLIKPKESKTISAIPFSGSGYDIEVIAAWKKTNIQEEIHEFLKVLGSIVSG